MLKRQLKSTIIIRQILTNEPQILALGSKENWLRVSRVLSVYIALPASR